MSILNGKKVYELGCMRVCVQRVLSYWGWSFKDQWVGVLKDRISLEEESGGG